MHKGKILKMRRGHEANCSSMSYMGHVLASWAGYAVFLTGLVGAQVVLRIGRLAARPWSGPLRLGVWVLPHMIAIPALWIWASGTGMTGYATVVCVGLLELALLISLGVGVVRLRSFSTGRAPAGPQERTSD